MGAVNSFCCCSLRQGTFCVGVISLMRAAVFLMMGTKWVQESNRLNYEDPLRYWESSSKEAFEAAVLGWASIIEGLILFFVTILLHLAVFTELRGYLYPWLIWGGIGVVLTNLTFTLVILPKYLIGETNGLVVFANLLISCLTIYFYVVVLSYNSYLKENDRLQMPGTQAAINAQGLYASSPVEFSNDFPRGFASDENCSNIPPETKTESVTLHLSPLDPPPYRL